jgi:hypothetical protein
MEHGYTTLCRIVKRHDTQPNDIKHKCIQGNNKNMTPSRMILSITPLSITTKHDTEQNDTQHNIKK